MKKRLLKVLPILPTSAQAKEGLCLQKNLSQVLSKFIREWMVLQDLCKFSQLLLRQIPYWWSSYAKNKAALKF